MLPVSDLDLGGNERKYLLEAFDSGWISGSGPFVDRFESAFAEYGGTSHAVTCANGTVALHLALLALGVGPGDEVIVPALTYIATANAVSYCGAKPVFADSESDTWNISADTITPVINPRTKGIIVVHLYGNPVDMDPVMKLAREKGLFVIEDAAQAHGAEYKGRKVGSIGDIATFSLYGNKMITTGEGGLVVSNDSQLIDKVRLLRGQGMDPDKRYWFPEIGYNYRLTNLQCAIGLGQLERIEEFIDKRVKLAAMYRNALDSLKGVKLQFENNNCQSIWWMFSICLENQTTRDEVSQKLERKNIETRPVFFPMHILPPYADADCRCPNADALGDAGLSLPTGAHVKQQDVEKIAEVVRRAVEL